MCWETISGKPLQVCIKDYYTGFHFDGNLSVGSLLSFVSVGQGLSGGNLHLQVAQASSWESQSSHPVVWSFSQIWPWREQREMSRSASDGPSVWGAWEVRRTRCDLLTSCVWLGSAHAPDGRWPGCGGKKSLLPVLSTRFQEAALALFSGPFRAGVSRLHVKGPDGI